MNNASTIASRKERWTRFLDRDPSVERMLIIRTPGAPARPPLWPTKRAERIDWIMKMYERSLDRLERIEDDSIPHLDMLTGTEIFAEALGCSVHRPDDNNPFALPLINDVTDAAKIRVPELGNSTLAYLFDMADELKRRAGNDAVLRMVDVQSPMDIAALVWEKTSFYCALIDDPAAVQGVSHAAFELLTAFLDEWFRRYGSGFVAHYPEYYFPRGVTLSEDEVGIVDTETFRTFFLPELALLSERYGGIGIHCCADSRHQWDGFKTIPGLKMLNICQPKDIAEESIRTFSGVCALWPGYSWKNGSAVDLHAAGNAHCVIDITAADEDEAKRIIETVRMQRAAAYTA